MPYQIVYSETSRKIIRRLYPSLKPLIKQKIESLREDPFLGKALERELTGYYSLRSKRYRVIYRPDNPGKQSKFIIWDIEKISMILLEN